MSVPKLPCMVRTQWNEREIKVHFEMHLSAERNSYEQLLKPFEIGDVEMTLSRFLKEILIMIYGDVIQDIEKIMALYPSRMSPHDVGLHPSYEMVYMSVYKALSDLKQKYAFTEPQEFFEQSDWDTRLF